MQKLGYPIKIQKPEKGRIIYKCCISDCPFMFHFQGDDVSGWVMKRQCLHDPSSIHLSTPQKPIAVLLPTSHETFKRSAVHLTIPAELTAADLFRYIYGDECQDKIQTKDFTILRGLMYGNKTAPLYNKKCLPYHGEFPVLPTIPSDILFTTLINFLRPSRNTKFSFFIGCPSDAHNSSIDSSSIYANEVFYTIRNLSPYVSLAN
ncbi:hypothetical protein WA158_006908 [Blastocystis sp. Blastoise]